jgi:hypothetical protein
MTMKILVTALAAAAGLALSTGAVLAQETSSIAPTGAFEDVDTDDNNLVSWTEFQLVFDDINEQQFNSADADGDGYLNADEYDSLVLQTGSITPGDDDGDGDEAEVVDPYWWQSTIGGEND